MDMDYGSTFPASEEAGSNQQGYRSYQSQGNQSNQGGYQNYGGYQGYQKPNNPNNYQGGYNKGGGRSGWRPPPETDLTLYKPYAIACNKDVPPHVVDSLQGVIKKLDSLGYTCRFSAGTPFDDTAESLATKQEMILPWKDFANKASTLTWNSERAKAVAKQFHPTYDAMKNPVQGFLARNARLILGNKMNSPALFFVLWSEDGAETLKEKTSRTGFVGHTLAIACSIGIPIYNLRKEDALTRLKIAVESTRIPMVMTSENT